jgi:hypothetical protein
MPVELVRGGMAFGEAKGWEVDGMVRLLSGRGGSLYRLEWRHSPTRVCLAKSV